MVNFTIDFNSIKELMMTYGFFTVTLTLTACCLLLVVALRLPALIGSLADLIRARRGQ